MQGKPCVGLGALGLALTSVQRCLIFLRLNGTKTKLEDRMITVSDSALEALRGVLEEREEEPIVRVYIAGYG